MLKRGQKGLRERQAMLMESQFERKKFTAEDVMIRPIFLYLEDDIETILEKLQSEEINYCVVVDEEAPFYFNLIFLEKEMEILYHININ